MNRTTTLMNTCNKRTVKQFQLYSSRYYDGAPTPDMENAKADYEDAAERYRSLSAELENKANVIIRHKPTRAAPVVLQAKSSSPIEVKAKTETQLVISPSSQVNTTSEPVEPILDSAPSSVTEREERSERERDIPPVVKQCEFCRSDFCGMLVLMPAYISAKTSAYNASRERIVCLNLSG